MSLVSVLRATALSALALVSFIAIAAGGDARPLTVEQAREIALGQTGGGEVVNAGHHRRGGRLGVYRFEILGDTGAYHVEIDESTGRLLKFVQKHGYRGGPRGGISVVTGPGATPASSGIGAEQALAIALERTGGGVVVESEIDRKWGGNVVYEYEIVNDGVKYDIEVDGDRGEIRKFKQKGKRFHVMTPAPGVSQGTPAASAGTRPRLGMDEAQKLALERTGGGVVREYKLDRDDGRLVHEMEIDNNGMRYDVEIDDASGQVIEFSVD